MNTLLSILVGGVVFYLIVWLLIPMLPAAIGTFVLVLVILIAIIWLIRLLGGDTWIWPWKK